MIFYSTHIQLQSWYTSHHKHNSTLYIHLPRRMCIMQSLYVSHPATSISYIHLQATVLRPQWST